MTPLKERLLMGLQTFPESAPLLSVKKFIGMGLGVVAEEPIQAGNFVMPYSGDVLTTEGFALRNEVYEKNGEGSYYIEVKTSYKGCKWVVDGTNHHGQV